MRRGIIDTRNQRQIDPLMLTERVEEQEHFLHIEIDNLNAMVLDVLAICLSLHKISKDVQAIGQALEPDGQLL